MRSAWWVMALVCACATQERVQGEATSSSDGGDDALVAEDSSTSDELAASSSDDGTRDPNESVGPPGQPLPSCGDGYVDPGEECDGDTGGLACEDLGFAGGWLRCNNRCELDTVGCDLCGNDVVDPGEQCDGSTMTEDCSCSSTCVRFGDGCHPSGVVITEIFTSPLRPRGGNVGQWFELYNYEDADRNLQGCTVAGEDPDEKFVIDQPVPFPAHGYATLGAGERSDLGLEPAFFLPREFRMMRAGDTIAIVCDGMLLDRVQYDVIAPWPPSVPARSIEVRHLDQGTNDSGVDWCTASSIYGIGHAGTPNAPNDCG
ncbi:MAG TPA: lamin tail domain-containing protein [Nannocystaceae bacterium]|nr:lamin tail domain-containing protein [Nannocystaceae bacterium]